MLRILGGQYKGKALESRESNTVRPTKAMIRESIFNILRHGKFLYEDSFITDENPSIVEGRRVLDIFCGSGALGLEAMSRGADELVLVDQDQETLKVARANAANVGVLDRTQFIRSDSSQLPQATKPCELIFIDPPYGKGLMKPALESLRDRGWLAHGAVIVAEQGKQDEPVVPDGYALLSDRTHDRTRIIILQYVGRAQ